MHVVDVLLQIIYLICVAGLALYGLQALWLTIRLIRHREPTAMSDKRSDTLLTTMPQDEWPFVTIQLPIYNEQHVVERLIAACIAQEYPSERLQIQILDDSDDLTTSLLSKLVQDWRSRGIQIDLVHRENRSGFKAGALDAALPTANGELIAIFDADFVPPADFLRCTVPHFLQSGNEDIGFVQARWDHLNRSFSWLTACQALALDGHFMVEQSCRFSAGYPFSFNGSAGVWRRTCIEDPAVGGWEADTLCEDLDLSYRAQFAGWRGQYLPHLDVPAEIPVQLLAFKRQQARWAKGSIQTLLKLSRRLLRQPWPLIPRLAGLGHLAAYLIHPLLLAMLLVSLPMLLYGVDPARPLAWLSLFSLGPPLLYAVAQFRLKRAGWIQRWLRLPLLMLLGTGLSLNNTVAVVSALLGQTGQFLRTPKFQIQSVDGHSIDNLSTSNAKQDGTWHNSLYRLPLSRMVGGEIALSLYALLSATVALQTGHTTTAPFLMLYAAGFGLIASTSIWQAVSANRHQARRPQSRRARLKAHIDRLQG